MTGSAQRCTDLGLRQPPQHNTESLPQRFALAPLDKLDGLAAASEDDHINDILTVFVRQAEAAPVARPGERSSSTSLLTLRRIDASRRAARAELRRPWFLFPFPCSRSDLRFPR